MKKSKIILIAVSCVLVIAMLATAVAAVINNVKLAAILDDIAGKGESNVTQNDLNGDALWTFLTPFFQ